MEEETRTVFVPEEEPPPGWVFGHRSGSVAGVQHVVWLSPDGMHNVWITSRPVVQRRMVTEWVDDQL